MANANGYKIDKNIPIPEIKNWNRRNYPFQTLAIGESFLMPSEIRFPAEAVRTARRRYFPKEYVYRKTEEGLRVWRTK